MYLQSRLNRAPEVTTLLAVDGKFGAATYRAVKQFQRAHRPLKDDGIVGPLTWSQVEQIPDEPVDKTAMAKKVFDAGKAAFTAGRFGHAYDFFTRAGQLLDEPVFEYNRAQSLRLLGGRREEAIALYEQYLKHPNDKTAANAKAMLEQLRGPG
jgi:tetratricopeptide (TPR) repeat protein